MPLGKADETGLGVERQPGIGAQVHHQQPEGAAAQEMVGGTGGQQRPGCTYHRQGIEVDAGVDHVGVKEDAVLPGDPCEAPPTPGAAFKL